MKSSKPSRGPGYYGPLVVLTPREVREVRDALHGRPGETAAVARAKCDAALNRNHGAKAA